MTASQKIDLLSDTLRDLLPVAYLAEILDGSSDTFVEGDYHGRIQRARAVLAGAAPCSQCGLMLCECGVDFQEFDEQYGHDEG